MYGTIKETRTNNWLDNFQYGPKKHERYTEDELEVIGQFSDQIDEFYVETDW